MAEAGLSPLLRDSFSPLVDRKNAEVEKFSSSQSYLEALAQTHCSRSKSVSVDNCSKLVLSRSKLKRHCRSGVEPAVRKRMWLDVVGVQDQDSVLLVKTFGEPQEDVAATSDHLIGMADLSNIASFHLREPSFTPGLERVLLASYRKLVRGRRQESVHAPLLPILAHLMLHFIDEWEVFAVLSHLMVRTAWLDQTRPHTAASHLTLLSLIHSHASSTLDTLTRLKPARMSQQAFLDKLSRNWYLWPFYKQPFWFAVRIVDIYVVEGPKLFYRLAISALKMFAALSQSLEGGSLLTAVQDMLCSLSEQQKARWLHDAFKIPHLRWVHILREWHSHVVASGGMEEEMVDGASVEDDSMDSCQDAEAVLEQSLIVPFSSEIVKIPEHWVTLWKWLPEWVTHREPHCLFRSSQDGYNLRTLYRKCEDQPCILLIKSENGTVFGCFIASELSERHNKQFFGTGETFLFTLLPTVQCYQWTAETDLILRANDHELIVGSGGGAFGLWLDSDLNQGSSNTCTAYKNPPLCGADAGGQFTCTCIEVYSCSQHN